MRNRIRYKPSLRSGGPKMPKKGLERRDLASFIVRITDLGPETFRGEVKNLATGRRKTFNSLIGFITFCQGIMDEYAVPLPVLETRSWKSDEGSVEEQIGQLLEFMRRTRKAFDEEHGEFDSYAESAR